MNKNQTWVEALNISPEMLNEWSSQAPPGKPVLVWCLEQGHVAASEYFMWAQEHYGLAVLSPEYFESGGLNMPFFQSQRHAGNWSPWCFPVDEWDSVTFVACVEPPSERLENHAYFLCDPRAMLDAWEMTGTGIPNATGEAGQEEPVIEAPMGITLDTKVFKLDLPDDVMLGSNTTVQERQARESAPNPKPPAEDTNLTTINSEPTVAAKGILQIDDNFTSAGDKSVVLSPETKVINMPKAPASAVDKMPPAPASARSASVPPAAPPAGTVKPGIQVPPITFSPKVTQAAAPAAPAAKAAPAPAAVPEETPSSFTEITKVDISAKTSVHRFATPVEKLDLPGNEQLAMQKCFAHINKIYQHSCVLRVQNNSAKLLRADANLKADPTLTQMDLTSPSFLRIVSKTGLPYHGYLVDTPAHREFFKHMGMAELPGCVTAVPLKVNGNIWGVLLAMGADTLQAMENLGMVEGTANQLLTALAPIWARSA